eukprot:4640108-Amphidinium_carterae.1
MEVCCGRRAVGITSNTRKVQGASKGTLHLSVIALCQVVAMVKSADPQHVVELVEQVQKLEA